MDLVLMFGSGIPVHIHNMCLYPPHSMITIILDLSVTCLCTCSSWCYVYSVTHTLSWFIPSRLAICSHHPDIHLERWILDDWSSTISLLGILPFLLIESTDFIEKIGPMATVLSQIGGHCYTCNNDSNATEYRLITCRTCLDSICPTTEPMIGS